MSALSVCLRVLTAVVCVCYGSISDNGGSNYVSLEAKLPPLDLKVTTDTSEANTFTKFNDWRKLVSPAITYPPLALASFPFYTDAVAILASSPSKEEPLTESSFLEVLLPHLTRFQNFYDDLIILGHTLSGSQYSTALNYAKRELRLEMSKMAKELSAFPLALPLNRMGWALLRVVLLDPCVQTQKFTNITICTDQYLSIAIPTAASVL